MIMKICVLLTCIFLSTFSSFGQNVGIVRKNYFSTYFDPTFNQYIEVFDSATIRLGSVNPYTGIVSNLSNNAYSLAINLNGATIDPYQQRYYIGSGFNLLTFDMNSGNLLNNVPVSGTFQSANFQNYRFNPSDSTIYGLVPYNFYSSYFDSLSMSTIEVLDSSQIRFASIDPVTGQYTLIGTTSFDNMYSLAGNSIDPFQMVYYYSAVDTLVGIDLYDGSLFSAVPIQLQPYGIFENIAYSCADTSIYGLTRQNYTSIVYDPMLMENIKTIDSTTFRLSKINPTTGEVTFISPYNIQAGGNLTGGAYIDPTTMTYFFNNGNKIVGMSLYSGLITSSVVKSYPSGEIAIDMMRSDLNCYGASKTRSNLALGTDIIEDFNDIVLYPNPVNSILKIVTNSSIKKITLIDLFGKEIVSTNQKSLDLSSVSSGVYIVNIYPFSGELHTQ